MPALLIATAESARFPLAMLLIFGSAKLLAELFERFRQPGIAGEILAGVLIGPSALGWIAPGGFLEALAELGVMFLLFRVGLEVKASELFEVGFTAALVAVLGVAAPFALGWGILRLWGYPHLESIFAGAAMVATSVGITAQVLASKGLLDAMASKIILAAAVIDDVLGLLVLSAVSSLARGRVDLLGLALTAAVAIGFTLIVARWGTRAVRRMAPRVGQRLRLQESQFALAICLLFALSVAAVYAGVAAIIGAFLAGMALSESVGARVHELTQGVAELLVPFFLVGVGLHIDVRVFSQFSMLALSRHLCSRGHLKTCRLRPGCVPIRPDGRVARGLWHDPSRRSGPGGGAPRPNYGRDFTAGLWRRRLYGSSHYARRPADAGGRFPRRNSENRRGRRGLPG